MSYLLPANQEFIYGTCNEYRSDYGEWFTTFKVRVTTDSVYAGWLVRQVDGYDNVQLITASARPYTYSYVNTRVYVPSGNPGPTTSGSDTYDTLNAFYAYGGDVEGYYPPIGSGHIITYTSYIPTYPNIEAFYEDIGIAGRPITYRLTNCTASAAPEYAIIGSRVNIAPVFTSGYSVVNPSSDVYVTYNGVTIPSTYANGVLSFTMP